MEKCVAVVALALVVGACVPTTHQTLAVSCSEYIGKPIVGRIAAYGPPKIVYRISPTQVGYVFETRETVLVGGHPYYTVNYLTGSDKHHTPVRPLTTACQGMFVVNAPTDTMPISQRVIVDVVPAY